MFDTIAITILLLLLSSPHTCHGSIRAKNAVCHVEAVLLASCIHKYIYICIHVL